MAYRFTPADRGAFKRCRRQWDFGARERQGYEPALPPPGPDLELAVRDALAVYYFPGMWDWQRSVVLPLVLQGLARSLGGQPAAGGGLVAGQALLGRYFEWAPGVDRFSPIQVECRFEVNLPDPAGGGRELVLPDGRPIRYQGRVDLLAGDEHDRYWVVAHRLIDRFGTAEALEWFKRGKLGMLPGFRELTPELRAVPNLDFDVMPMPTIDRAATRGALHRNTAARKKSQAAKLAAGASSTS